MTIHSGPSYEKPLHTPEQRDKIIAAIRDSLSDKMDLFDGFVVQGYSMTIIGSILAHVLGKDIAVIRKPGEKRNSSYNSEGRHSQRWVFVDDLIASGATYTRVEFGVNQELQGKIVGICLWSSYGDVGTLSNGYEQPPVWMNRCLPDEWHAEEKRERLIASFMGTGLSRADAIKAIKGIEESEKEAIKAIRAIEESEKEE